MPSRIPTTPIVLLLGALALAACGGTAAAPAANAGGAQATQPALANGEGGGEGGGAESALVTYSDAAQGFAIHHPGPWT